MPYLKFWKSELFFYASDIIIEGVSDREIPNITFSHQEVSSERDLLHSSGVLTVIIFNMFSSFSSHWLSKEYTSGAVSPYLVLLYTLHVTQYYVTLQNLLPILQ